MRTRRLATVLASCIAVVGIVTPAATGASLEARVGTAVRQSAVGGSTSVYVWDQATRDVLYTHTPSTAVTPASTMKLLTSSAALAQLGPDHRFETKVALDGHQAGNRWIGDVWLIGGGDPSLSTYGFLRDNYGGRGANLASLVAPLRTRGIEGVTGRIMVDDDLFDEQRWVEGWKPAFRFEEAGALGALTVNQSLVGRYVGSDSAHAPDLRAGTVFRQLLTRQGVFVAGPTESGSVPEEAEIAGSVSSPPLEVLLEHMNRTSDNFYAETLLKQVGVARFGARGTGSTEDGRRAARSVLSAIGIDMRPVTWVDGSGLAYGNRVTARTLGHVLGVGAQAEWGGDWIDSMATSGGHGTLRRRLTRPPYRGRVHAKTGTLNHASGLAGFSDRSSGRRYGFVVLTYDAAGRRINYSAARGLQDRIAAVLVR
ncbi:MAG: hypothetical protein JWM86_1432 [Thermoleophilia bacterium]|nr:hypothetical protein [Thermoleophilia bacterium]